MPDFPKKTICFIAPGLHNMLVSSGNFSGCDVRAYYFISGLLENNHISCTIDSTSNAIETKNNIVFFHQQQLLHLSPAECTQLIQKVNADIYIAFGINDLNQAFASACNQLHKLFILMLASDHDFYFLLNENNQINDYGSSRTKCLELLQSEAHLVAQTQHQQKLASSLLNRNIPVFFNPIDLERKTNNKPKRDVLWVGTNSRIKNPGLAFELARQHKDITFTFILNKMSSEQKKWQSENIIIYEHIPFAEIEYVFSTHRILLNTSQFEGFPNAFLQAAKYGMPILTFQVNPDNIISEHQCGYTAMGNFAELDIGIKKLLNDSDFYQKCSKNIQQHVGTFHDQTVIIKNFQNYLNTLKTN